MGQNYYEMPCNPLGMPTYFVDQPTNGITYFRMKFDLKDFPEDKRKYLKLFCQ